MSKAAIPGIIATVNENISRQEQRLKEVLAQHDRLEDQYNAESSELDVKERDLRQSITRLQTTVNVLEEMS
jgi:uncharacterized protein YjhX (UPF0386 family)